MLFRTALAVVVLAASALAAPPAPTFLVEEGKSRAAIFLPRVAGKATILAANELHDYLLKITGADVPVEWYASEKMPAYRRTSKILLQPRVDPARETSADGSEDVFTIEESAGRLVISGGSDVAVLYGVYEYLHSLGVRWFMPGELGENVPALASIPLTPGRRIVSRPAFRTREIDYSGEAGWHFAADRQEAQMRDYALWLVRNKLHYARFISREPFDFNQSRERNHHNVSRILRNVSIEQEPDRFALVTRSGETRRRLPRDGAQICFTHPANVQATIEAALRFFAESPQMLTFPTSLEDHGGICECAECVRANGGLFPPDPNRLVWSFQNAVARGLRERLPEKRIAFYACYGGMTHPPEGTRAEPGVVAVACHVQSNSADIVNPGCPWNRVYYDHLLKIKATGAEMGCYDYTMYAGCPQPLSILNSVKTYRDLGYVWYHTESMGRDEQRNIVAWVQAQMAWDASSAPDALLDEFCAGYYGPAGDNVRDTLRAMETGVRLLPKMILGSMGVAQSILSDEVIAAGRASLDAGAARVNGRYAQRLARFRETFEMLSRRALACRAAYHAMNARTPDALAAALGAWEAFFDFWRERDLDTTCSPWIRKTDQYFVENKLRKMPLEIRPAASKDLAAADDAVRLRELFARDTPPGTLANLFYLPEVWKFRADVLRTGLRAGWTAPEFDDAAWASLSTWNFYERQGFDWYDGAFCYRVRFKAPEFPKGRAVYLRIGALDDEGDIYLNGVLVHSRKHLHPLDWMTSFEIDVTAHLKSGDENVVVVMGNDEYGLGGLWKPCALYTR